MAVIQNSFTGNGSTTTYSFTFPYLKTADIKASIDAAVTTAFTLPTATTLQFNSAPANGAKIKIYRETDADALTATFYAGSAIKSEDLNDNFTQNLYGVQEVTGRYMSNIGGTMTGDLTMAEDADIIFEGATDDAHETRLTVADPTADRTITLPNVTGTVVTTGDTGTVTSTMIANATIATADLANNAVTVDKIAGGAVANAKLANDAVTVDKIASGAVANAKLADDAVTAAKIAPDAVTASELANNAVDTAAIADNAVTTAKVANGTINHDKLTNDSVIEARIANGAVTTAKLANNGVETAKIADTAVTEAKLATNSVTLAKMTDNSVGTSELVNDAVTADKIATNAVTADGLADNAVDNNALAADAVTSAKIADNAINSEHYTDGSIENAHIANGAVNHDKLTTDSVIEAKIANNAVTVSKIADAELSTLAGMQSGTASVLAGGTALAATLTEINTICDGKGNQTTITNSDAHYPTSGAVVDYVAAQIAPIGGLEVIANDASFPEVQPAAGVVISIADAGGLVVNGSGVSTTGRTVASTPATVTINGINSAYNSSTVTAGVGFLVSSTGSGQVYNFHKSVIRDQDILSISSDIDDFANRYRVGSSNPSSSNDAGDLFYNTTTNKLLTYNATSSAWEEAQSIGDFYISTISSFSGTGGNSASFNGSAYKFTISNAPTNAQQLLVSINGVVQKPNAGTSQPSEGFALDGSAIIFSSAPASGSDYFITVQGSAVNVGSPSDNTVSTAKIQNGAVTTDKLGSDAVTGAKIADDAVGAEHIETLDSHLLFADNSRAKFGDGSDLHIYHNGSNSVIREEGTGNLNIQTTGGNVDILVNTTETAAKFISDGAVELYYDGSLQTKTTSTGLHLADDKRIDFGTSSDLRIYHDANTNWLELHNDNALKITKGANTELIAKFTPDSSVELYHNDGKRFETTSTGAAVTGSLGVGTTSPLKKLHISDAGDVGIALQTTNANTNKEIWEITCGTNASTEADLVFQSRTDAGSGGSEGIRLVNGGAVNLYHDNSKKFETESGGVAVTGGLTVTTNISLVDDGKVKLGTGDDLQLFHDATHSWVRNYTGILYLGNADGSPNDVRIQAKYGEESIVCNDDGAVELYCDNEMVFNTHSEGISVRNTNGNGELYLIAGEGSGCQMYFYADEGDDNGDKFRIDWSASHNFGLQTYDTGSWANRWVMDKEGRVDQIVDVSNSGVNCYEMNKAGSSVATDTAQSMILFQVGGYNRSGIESGSGGSDLGAFYSTSDRRIKTNFRTYTGGWDKIKQIPVKLYDELLNDDTKELIGDKPKTNCLGWIADELQQVFPEAVHGTKDAVDGNGKPIFQTITQQRIFPDVVQALQAAITKIETLETKVAALEAA